MRDRLKKGELALAFGTNLPPKNAQSISAQIISKINAAGAYTTVKFQIEFELDLKCLKAYNHPNVPAQPGQNYQVNYNEVGFKENSQLVTTPSKALLNVSFIDNTAMLNVSVPLDNEIKRDSGN